MAPSTSVPSPTPAAPHSSPSQHTAAVEGRAEAVFDKMLIKCYRFKRLLGKSIKAKAQMVSFPLSVPRAASHRILSTHSISPTPGHPRPKDTRDALIPLGKKKRENRMTIILSINICTEIREPPVWWAFAKLLSDKAVNHKSDVGLPARQKVSYHQPDVHTHGI